MNTFSLTERRGEKSQLVLMHKNIKALDYTESQIVNHREGFQCPAAKYVSYDISEILFLYMYQEEKKITLYLSFSTIFV